MPRRPSRVRIRAALEAASVPTWSGSDVPAADPASLRFRTAPGRLPPGLRVYAIGDVRGALPELLLLDAAIAADLRNRPVRRPVVVFLGNLIGPGPDSAGVLRRLAYLSAVEQIALRGDIEHMLLQALDGDRPAATDWLHAGGSDCLRSWGLPADTPREEWAARIPAAHIAVLRALRLSWRAGDYLFVHAGVRPGVPPDAQAPEDLISIRQPFLASEADHGPVIVHGHNAAPRPELRPNRIGLDTGAGIGGRLTCAIFEGDNLTFLSPAV